jgi:hypothetical protein
MEAEVWMFETQNRKGFKVGKGAGEKYDLKKCQLKQS